MFMDLLIENINKIITIISLFSISIYFRVVLQALGQTWIKTISHTSTIVILPIITYIITNVISGNIALSLGMIGALSIIRFRNPVKNPLELVMFFGLLTIGIGLSVKVILGVLLTFGICIALVVVDKLNLYLKKNGKGLFSISFDDGILNNVIEISSSTSI